ncbi:hypothetical protein [Spirosoma foliorum]|uniref:Fibronectin type-III domain-containing protein n=1 Tax=Spirosoma foliorum TaxID=2710596 RepID=A0A7G5GWS9_9BACT|nr:hypothetical protein [Spirosoma foliorum]QMW03321.1 hypothetical protein H3H32_36630 [Spirosoma foliorum]
MMKSVFIKLYLLIVAALNLLVVRLCVGQGQPHTTNPTSLTMLAKVEKSGVILRWSPLNYETWQAGNQFGYQVIRTTFWRDGKPVVPRERTVLTTQPLRPLPKSYWDAAEKKDKYARVAGGLLYGKESIITPIPDAKKEPNTEKELQNDKNIRVILALFSADMSPGVAVAMGLRLADRTVKANERYEYRVFIQYPALTPGQATPDTARVLLAPSVPTIVPRPEQLTFHYADSTTLLRWDAGKPMTYSAFVVERSDDGGKQYRSISPQPLLAAPPTDSTGPYGSKMDKVPTLYKHYYYRVRGITPFGEYSPPSASVDVFAYRTDLSGPTQVIYTLLDSNKVALHWNFPDSLARDIRGFDIVRAKALGGQYTYLSKTPLRRTERAFVDLKPEKTNYYRIVALDWGGHEHTSYPLLVQLSDSIPPARPTNLTATVSKEGVVNLRWKAPDDNDLMGFRVYRSSQKNHEYSLITKKTQTQTTFTDTVSLKQLDKYIYYFVVALDQHYNPSRSSDTLRVKRPDVIPPTAPVFANYQLTDSTIQLAWKLSSSLDVSRHVLYRRTLPDTTFRPLLTFPVNRPLLTYADTALSYGAEYEYVLQAIDESGLTSGRDCRIKLQTFSSGIRPPIRDVQLQADRAKRQFVVHWTYPQKAIKHYLIYRQRGNERLSLYKVIDGKLTQWIDTEIVPDVPYQYRLMALFTDNGESKLSASFPAILPAKE